MEQPNIRDLEHVLVDLALQVLTDRSLKADLERLIRLVTGLIPNCTAASAAILVDGQPTTVAISDRVAMELDVVQYDSSDGPCLACLGGQQIRVAYLPADVRFPHFAAGAADRRISSVLSTPAIDGGVVIGSLNLYSRHVYGFDAAAEAVALIFAAEIATAIARSDVLRNARTTREQLQEQYDEAAVVSMAEDVMMAVQDCSAEQATELIHRASDINDEQLITTAERILAAVNDVRHLPAGRLRSDPPNGRNRHEP
jgi:GAF domain-containing protein